MAAVQNFASINLALECALENHLKNLVPKMMKGDVVVDAFHLNDQVSVVTTWEASCRVSKGNLWHKGDKEIYVSLRFRNSSHFVEDWDYMTTNIDDVCYFLYDTPLLSNASIAELVDDLFENYEYWLRFEMGEDEFIY